MFYRAYELFNDNGILRSGNFINKKNIIRNTDHWVYKAEKECSDIKLLKYLEYVNSPIKDKIKDFKKSFIYNQQKPFTVRKLCNIMKHNHSLQFEELYEPYEYFVNINGNKVNLREKKLGIHFNQEFYSKDNSNTGIGVVKTYYSDDLEIDIEYYGNDSFRYSDCVHNRYKITDVLNECILYYDAIVDLFEDIYNEIYPNIALSLSLNMQEKPFLKNSNKNINLNRYFMPT